MARYSTDPSVITRWPRLLVGTLVAGACLVQSLPAVAAPAPLPEWGVKQKPAPLPDWDTAAKKPADPAKKPKAKKPGPAATQPKPATTPPGPATTPLATEPEPVVATEPEPVVAPEPEPVPEPEPAVAAPAEPVPAEPEPVVPTAPEPEPEPVGPRRRASQARRAERPRRDHRRRCPDGPGPRGCRGHDRGFLLQDGGAEDDGRNTMIAAGAVSGAIGLALGVAPLVDGVRDLKATRPGRSARVRVAPTFGGLARQRPLLIAAPGVAVRRSAAVRI